MFVVVGRVSWFYDIYFLIPDDGKAHTVLGSLVQVRVDSTIRDITRGEYTPRDTGQFVYSYFVAVTKTTPSASNLDI
jgi:hypothetical protein